MRVPWCGLCACGGATGMWAMRLGAGATGTVRGSVRNGAGVELCALFDMACDCSMRRTLNSAVQHE